MDHNRDFVKRLCDLEIPGEIKISPGGDNVLYSTSLTWGHSKGKHSVSKLWLATWGRGNSSKQITDGTYKDHSVAWHPIKDEFAFVSDRAGNGTKSAIYTMPLTDIGNSVPVTPVENEQAIEKFQFSSNGKMIAFISKDEKTEEERQREERQEDVQVWGQGERFSRLRVIDLETGKTRTLSFDQHVTDFCWVFEKAESSEELEIAFVSCDSTSFERPYLIGNEIHMVSASLNDPRKVLYFPNKVNHLCWGSLNSGQSNELYFWSSAPVTKSFSSNALYKVNIKKGLGEYEQIAGQDHVDITLPMQSIGGHIIGKAQKRLEELLMWYGNKPLYSCNQDIEAFDVCFLSDGQIRLAIATSDVNHPVEVYSINGHNGEKVQLSQHGDSLQGQEFGTCITLSCPTLDHHKIEIDGIFLQPAFRDSRSLDATPSKPYPTVVLIHGGPRMRITNAFNTLYYMWTPYLLSLGYAVMLPNYRGSSGRGEEFSCFNYDGVGNHAYTDVIALTQYAVEKGYADPDRLVVGGYSHGGLLTNLCALRNGSHEYGWKFKAAISGACISDIDSSALTSEIMGKAYISHLHNGAAPWTMYPHDTSTRAASALWAFKEVVERSARERTSIIPPVLILHGAIDDRTHISNAWGLQRALEHYSLPCEMVIYPRQGHVFHEQYFWIDMALRIGRWVEQYIGPGRKAPTVIHPFRSR